MDGVSSHSIEYVQWLSAFAAETYQTIQLFNTRSQ